MPQPQPVQSPMSYIGGVAFGVPATMSASLPKGTIGQGSMECSICQTPITEFKTLKIEISLPSRDKPGKRLATLRYFLPLCDMHAAQPEAIEVLLEWESSKTQSTSVLS